MPIPRNSARKTRGRQRNMKDNKDDCGTSSAISPLRSEARDDEVMEEAIEVLGQALPVQEKEPHGENVRDKDSIGNHHGLNTTDLLARIHELEVNNALIKEKLASHDTEITKLGGRQVRVTPALSVEKYRPVQNQSISSFKYDKLNHWDFLSDEDVMGLGGDAIVDAAVCLEPPGSENADAIEALYGLNPQQVLRMKNHWPTITVLNTHATVLSSRHKVGSKKFYDLFAKFVKLLKESDFDESYLDDGKRDNKLVDLACAYQSFVQCAKEEVFEVKK